MKKSSHTMVRNIGIYVLGLLVFLAISCSQDVLAANNLTLKVNAGSNTTTANKIYYRTGTSTTPTPVTLPWTEKAVYNGTSTADADVKITVTNGMAKTVLTADLIVKVDFLTATSAGAMTVTSGWLKYADDVALGGGPGVVIAHDTEVLTYNGVVQPAVDKATLSTLVLKEHFVGGAAITLFNFSTKFNSATHIIFTAILVDNADLPDVHDVSPFPQVLGVDVQTVFFNYIDTSVTTTSGSDTAWFDVTPIWLTFIQAVPPPLP